MLIDYRCVLREDKNTQIKVIDNKYLLMKKFKQNKLTYICLYNGFERIGKFANKSMCYHTKGFGHIAYDFLFKEYNIVKENRDNHHFDMSDFITTNDLFNVLVYSSHVIKDTSLVNDFVSEVNKYLCNESKKITR